MKATLRIFPGVLVLFLFSACSKLSPKIEAPSYIRINNYKVNYSGAYSGNGGPGSSNHKFTDVLVYANNHNLGFYPIPCTIPIPFDGQAEIKIKPVIKTNGLSAIRNDYPFMKFYTLNTTLQKSLVSAVTPEFDYYSSVNFKWVEDFENTGSSLVGHGNGDTCGKKVSAEKFEGNYAYQIQLGSKEECTLRSSYGITLPASSTNIYLELNYKAEQDFEVGIMGVPSSGGAVTDIRQIGGVNASNGEWKKIYLFLTHAVSTYPLYNNYYVYFYIRKNPELNNPKIYLDNIKLISQT